MSWWKYKPMFDIKWREPYEFTRALSRLNEKTTRWWKRLFWGIINSAILMLAWLIAPDAPSLSPTLALIIAVLGGFGIVYLVSIADYFLPREIGFGPKAIVSMSGTGNVHWPYKHILEVRFENQTFRQKQFQIMFITMANKKQLVAAVPDKIKIQEVIDLLSNKGIEAIVID